MFITVSSVLPPSKVTSPYLISTVCVVPSFLKPSGALVSIKSYVLADGTLSKITVPSSDETAVYVSSPFVTVNSAPCNGLLFSSTLLKDIPPR